MFTLHGCTKPVFFDGFYAQCCLPACVRCWLAGKSFLSFRTQVKTTQQQNIDCAATACEQLAEWIGCCCWWGWKRSMTFQQTKRIDITPNAWVSWDRKTTNSSVQHTHSTIPFIYQRPAPAPVVWATHRTLLSYGKKSNFIQQMWLIANFTRFKFLRGSRWWR